MRNGDSNELLELLELLDELLIRLTEFRELGGSLKFHQSLVTSVVDELTELLD